MDIFLCLDLFPAYDRLKTAIFQSSTAKTVASKVHAVSDVISESVGMFSDVYWIVEECKSFNIVKQTTFNWAGNIYKHIAFLKYLGTAATVYQSYKIMCFIKTCKTLQLGAPETSSEDRKKIIEKKCLYLQQNYQTLEKSFTITSDTKAKIVKLSKEHSLDAYHELQKIEQKIRRLCLFDICSTANTVTYYALYVVRCCLLKNRVISLLILATCIVALALSVFSFSQRV